MPEPQLQGYDIHREIASGGMAKIYDATQLSLNRAVAIKFLSSSLLSHHEASELFEKESLIIARLNHPNIVQVIDKGVTEDSQPYFVMEKINGVDLSKMLSGAQLPFHKNLDISIQICKGLAYAHKNGVIHRDIKPANIIIDQHGNAKILDFGIALTADENTSSQSSVVGTEGFVAPEQEKNSTKATVASDIYSYGQLLKALFEKDLHNKKVPTELISLCNQCTLKNPNERFKSLNEVRDRLLSLSQGRHLAKANIEAAEQENEDLASQFIFLDVLNKTLKKHTYLFQRKNNQQLLVIKRQLNSSAGFKQAKLLASLKHPNIVRIIAATKKGPHFVLITEYLSGGSLAGQLVQDLSEQVFLTYACQICAAIYFAHQNNVLHANLTPENILFDQNQNIKIGDFAQRLNKSDDPSTSSYFPPGTQAYSEQYDIYCMGAIFHHMLYGVTVGETKPHSNEKRSFRLEKLIDKMLAIDPVNRPTTAQQVLIELQRIARANSGNNKTSNRKDRKSRIAEKKQQTIISKEKNKRAGRSIGNPQQSPYWMVAFGISLLVIAALILKDFI